MMYCKNHKELGPNYKNGTQLIGCFRITDSFISKCKVMELLWLLQRVIITDDHQSLFTTEPVICHTK